MSRARQRGTGTHAGGRGRRRGRGPYALLGLICAALLGLIVFVVKPGSPADAGTSAAPSGSSAPAASPDTPAATSGTTSAKGSAKGSASPGASTQPKVPQHGTGTFTTADASGQAAGHGDIRRYEVQVEGGAGISATSAAHEIQSILADPRGWTNDGRDGFELVSSGSVDFVVKIATPDTTDAICGAAGLHTHGEVNCDVGPTVVVNLKRWLLGSPQFDGPVEQYRALIINHEVGHRIGHGHEGCPGPGKLAPVMMQQIDGLHGCKANAWPYDSDGHYIQGPPVA
jgi:hypothetical protein